MAFLGRSPTSSVYGNLPSGASSLNSQKTLIYAQGTVTAEASGTLGATNGDPITAISLATATYDNLSEETAAAAYTLRDAGLYRISFSFSSTSAVATALEVRIVINGSDSTFFRNDHPAGAPAPSIGRTVAASHIVALPAASTISFTTGSTDAAAVVNTQFVFIERL